MKSLFYNLLKVLRKLYGALIIRKPRAILPGRNWKMFSNKEYSNDLIYQYLIRDEPCMIARLGSGELSCMVNYIGVKENNNSLVDYIKGKSLLWWWDPARIDILKRWSGFFPSENEPVDQFCSLMINDLQQVDILGSWQNEENYFEEELQSAKRVVLEDLEPFFCKNPWTKALAKKKVLVVHPFADTITKQYQKRDVLFDNELLPQFELKTIKAVQTVAGTKTEFSDWFAALEWMKQEIDNVDYDICIIGCGAYGFPLAAHVKRMGKKSIHLAGSTQLLFGIIGKRWENYIVWPYKNLFNSNWVRPDESEKPANAVTVEGGSYW